MELKKYKIKHNPYSKETFVYEYFKGVSIPWAPIGGKSMSHLNMLLETSASINHIGMDILKEIESYHRDYHKGEYMIEFQGIQMDYNSMNIICDEFKKNNPNSSLSYMEQSESLMSSPEEMLSTLDKACSDIFEIYKDHKIYDELQKSVDECNKVKNEGLNILVMGTQNAGKSTLINALIGMELLPVSGEVETALVFVIKKSEDRKNHLEIHCYDGSIVKVEFLKNCIKYNDSNTQVNSTLDTVNRWFRDDENNISSHEMVKRTVKELNETCKKMKDKTTYHKVIIELSDLRIADSMENFCIWDFPGAGAKYMGENHRKLISQEINQMKNAVVVYVLKSDDRSLDSVQKQLEEIKEADAKGEGRIRNQIDFERSIYVFNKADADKGNGNVQDGAIEREFGRKDVVLTAAHAALQIRTKNKDEIEDDTYIKFVEPYRNTPLMDLQKDAKLSPIYKDRINEMVDDALKHLELSELTAAFKRTGIPVITALLVEYSRQTALIHKVDCYYSALEEMWKNMNGKVKECDIDLKKKKEVKEKEQENTRIILKGICEKKCTEYKNVLNANSDKLKENLITANKGSYETITKEIENIIKETLKNKSTKKDWRNYAGDGINKRIDEESKKVEKNVQKVEMDYVEELKKTLLKNIKAKSLSVEEQEEIYKFIKSYNPEMVFDEFSIEKLKRSDPMDFITSIVNTKFWKTHKVKEQFDCYWENNILNPYFEPLRNNIINDYEDLKTKLQSKLDKLSPQLQKMQEEIDKTEQERNELKDKVKKSEKIINACKTIYRGDI